MKESRASRGELARMMRAFDAGSRFASHTLLATAFPTRPMNATQPSFHESSVQLFTFVMCVPRWRCTPLQSMHMNNPRLMEAQVGSFAPQSTQVLFSGRCMMAFKALCCLDDILLVHTRFPGRKRRCCLCYAQTHSLVVENRH